MAYPDTHDALDFIYVTTHDGVPRPPQADGSGRVAVSIEGASGEVLEAFHKLIQALQQLLSRRPGKVSDADVVEIRRLVASGMSRGRVAKLFRVTPQYVGQIASRKAKKNVL